MIFVTLHVTHVGRGTLVAATLAIAGAGKKNRPLTYISIVKE